MPNLAPPPRRALSRALCAAAAALLAPRPAAAQAPASAAAPERTVVATVGVPFPMGLSLEAGDDGWLVLTEYHDRDPGSRPVRTFLRRDEAAAWARAARAALAVPADRSADAWRALGVLGAGSASRLVPTVESGAPAVRIQRCGRDGPQLRTRAQVEQLVWAIERATLLTAGRAAPAAPTLARPYAATEVTCPALHAAAPVHLLPHALPSGAERETAARFVVDTGGFVEPASITILPGTSAAAAAAARAVVLGWRYGPALVGAAPVRQEVHAVVRLDARTQEDADAERTEEPPHRRRTVRADSGGWVHVRELLSGPEGTYVQQEWYTPAQVDSFVRRLPRWLDSLRVPHARRGWLPPPRLGVTSGALQTAHEGGNEHGPVRAVSWSACNPTHPPEFADLDAYLGQLAAAAAQARALRAVPLPPAARPYGADEVACPAQPVWPSPSLPGGPAARRYADVPATAAVTAGRVRDEVLASVVVDRAGVPDVRTLRVMPGADPRAAAAVVRALPALRWRPATRGGVPVAQRVFETFAVSPPPRCLPDVDDPVCPREYAPR